MTSYDQDYGPPVTGDLPLMGRVARPRGRLVIPSIEAMRAYPPGKPWRQVAAELGLPDNEVLLLAANENLHGCSPRAREAAARALAEAHLYPDGNATELKAALAAKLGVDVGRLVVGNGSNEIIELLVRTFVGPDESVVSAWPSFVVYRLAAQAQGRDAVLAPLFRERYDLPALGALVDHRTKLVFIANPNNPTGTYVSRRELAAFLERIPPQVIVVLDEAYFEYASAPDYPSGLTDFPGRERLVVLRTFSKAYGLAGLRVGYGVMSPELVDYLDRVRQPYNTSVVAQAAAIAALADDTHLAQVVAATRAGRAQLEEGLRGLKLGWVPSQANFVVVHVPVDGDVAQAQLKTQGLLVRSMAAYGMPRSVRVTVGTPAMIERTLAGLATLR
jgi:histidinol-phosphate aminotransferase